MSTPVTEQTTSPPPEIVLTESQELAKTECVEWAKDVSIDPKTKTLSGPAGTGKTQLISVIQKELSDTLKVAVAAFTGKAASVLRGKGVLSAQTLHSLMYTPVTVNNQLEFRPVSSLGVDFVIVDESSMVAKDILTDLLKYKVKVLFVGDGAQLEPIGDDPNLMADPDILLTEIHRQAQGSPIIQFSVILRNGGEFQRDFNYGTVPGLTITSHFKLDDYIYEADQVICGFNKTRHDLNRKIREKHNRVGTLAIGDRLICLKNNRLKGVYNGMIMTVTSFRESGFSKNTLIVTGVDEVGTEFKELPVSKKCFGENTDINSFKDREVTYWDYGYCITAHKSQGSQWKNVLVIEQLASMWNPARWRYTACTRAQENLTYLI